MASMMVKIGCKLLFLILFVIIIIIIVIIIIIIIIAIIYKNENPMVCLLALWVYKCFFSLKTSSYTLYKKMDFSLFFMPLKMKKPVFFTLDPVAALVYNRTDR